MILFTYSQIEIVLPVSSNLCHFLPLIDNDDCCNMVQVAYVGSKIEDYKGYQNIYGIYRKIDTYDGHSLYQSHCSAENDQKFYISFCKDTNSWYIKIVKPDPEDKDCGGYVVKNPKTDEKCVENTPVLAWEYWTWKNKGFKPANMALRVICADDQSVDSKENDCSNDDRGEHIPEIGEDDSECQTDLSEEIGHMVLDSNFELVNKLHAVRNYLKKHKNRPKCNSEVIARLKEINQTMDNLEEQMNYI